MISPLLVYQLLVLAVLLALLGMVVVNMAVLPSIEAYRTGEDQPNLAVLVPARNEAANIEACLRGLLQQDYPHYSVWLYDDASTDSTGQIASRIAAEYSGKLHIVRGSGDPPPGWLGKANACTRLYEAAVQQASPEYVLFTDADVRHEPRMLRQAVAAARSLNSGLLSIFPRQVMHTWAERLAVPMMQCWAVYGILPLPLAFARWTGPAFAAANGQFMLFTTKAYSVCGGHGAVRSDVLEDVGMAREVKRAGYRVVLADGGPLVRTRMYSGAGEVWKGYSKNVFAFFGYSPLFLALGALALAGLYIVPPVVVLYAAAFQQFTPEWFYLPLAAYLVSVLTRLVLSVRFAYPLGDAALHPVAVGYLIAIAANSMRWARTGRGEWKGRPHIAPEEKG